MAPTLGDIWGPSIAAKTAPMDRTIARLTGEPMPRPLHAAVSEEGLYMELLAAEHSGKEPDDGELEGSGDDYLG
ncbi:hypothetical protein DFH08DRAFT_966046 [Mycena albidolilacea]|uniref:Uncharacterized protein n=1 Tax=Mycena albidolilacea TaxID=1033008 RepID=A0AAD6ZP92_9AGAR|nr:hypothetical protein DFH08DRAFT_966046 [Mycena albidolilacea]